MKPKLGHRRLHRRNVDDLVSQRVGVPASAQGLAATTTRLGDALCRRRGREKFAAVALVARLTTRLSTRWLSLRRSGRSGRWCPLVATASALKLSDALTQHANLLEGPVEQAFQFGDARVARVDRLHASGEIMLGDPCRPPPVNAYISKDVKVQVAFDERVVRCYRLLGYENRDVRDEDFRNDAVDGGELHAGHTVTALYELELTGNTGALASISVRGKQPANGQAFELATRVPQSALARSVNEATADFRFATAVAMAADVLRGNAHAGVSLREAKALAETAASDWPERREFVSLLNRALSGEGLVSAPLAANYQY
jgi:hypothetical protein